MAEKTYQRETAGAVSVAINLVTTEGKPADWIQTVAGGSLVFKDGGDTAVTYANTAAGEVFHGPFRAITSSAGKLRYGTGQGPLPPQAVSDAGASEASAAASATAAATSATAAATSATAAATSATTATTQAGAAASSATAAATSATAAASSATAAASSATTAATGATNAGTSATAAATSATAAATSATAAAASAVSAAASSGYTVSTASYTQPAVGSTVSVAVSSTAWMIAGNWVNVTGGGYYTISSVTDGTNVVLTNTGHSANAAAAATVATSKIVLPSAPALPLYVGSITFNGSSADTGVAVTIPGLTTAALVMLGRGDDAQNAGTLRAVPTTNTLTIRCTQALSTCKIPYSVMSL